MVGSESQARGDSAYDEPAEFSPDRPVLNGARAAAWSSDEPPPPIPGTACGQLPGSDPDGAGLRPCIVWAAVPEDFVRWFEVRLPNRSWMTRPRLALWSAVAGRGPTSATVRWCI